MESSVRSEKRLWWQCRQEVDVARKRVVAVRTENFRTERYLGESRNVNG